MKVIVSNYMTKELQKLEIGESKEEISNTISEMKNKFKGYRVRSTFFGRDILVIEIEGIDGRD